jgi:hypothetical protein
MVRWHSKFLRRITARSGTNQTTISYLGKRAIPLLKAAKNVQVKQAKKISKLRQAPSISSSVQGGGKRLADGMELDI